MSIREKELQKIRGEAGFANDIHPDNLIHAAIVRSTEKECEIASFELPELPKSYYFISAKDIPGEKYFHQGSRSMPYLYDEEIRYIGQPLFIIAGPERFEVARLASEVSIEYSKVKDDTGELEPKEANVKEPESRRADPKKGEPDHKKKSLPFKRCITMNIHGGGIKKTKENTSSDHGSMDCPKPIDLELNTVVSLWNKENLILYAPVQNPYLLKSALTSAIKIPQSKLKIIVPFICDPFNQKSTPAIILSVYCALVSKVTAKACKISIHNTDEYQHCPSFPGFRYKIQGVKNKDKLISSLDMHFDYHVGAYDLFSQNNDSYSSIPAKGLYHIENKNISIKLISKPTAPAQLTRGYCEPSIHFAVENFMNSYAAELGENPLDTRINHVKLAGKDRKKKNIFPNIKEFLINAGRIADFKRKWSSYHLLCQKNSYSALPSMRRGIGMALCPHYIYPACEHENQNYKLTCLLDKNKKLRIQSSLIDIHQNRSYTLSNTAAKILNLHLSEIIFETPNLTSIRKIEPIDHIRTMIMERLVKEACLSIKQKHKHQKLPITVTKRITWPKYGDQFLLSCEPESLEATIVEVEIDPVDLCPRIRGVWIYYYLGPRFHEKKISSQIQSALNYNLCQAFRNPSTKPLIYGASPSDNYAYTNSQNQAPSYINFDTSGDEDDRPRSLGHLAITGAAPALKAAVEQALKIKINKSPFSPQDLYKELKHHED